MSKTLKRQDGFNDLIARYKALRKDADNVLNDVDKAGDAKQVERLLREFGEHSQSIETLLAMLNGPEIGDEAYIEGWSHEEFFKRQDGFTPVGEIIEVDGNSIRVRIPQQVLRQQTVPAHIVTAIWFADTGWVNVGSECELLDVE